MTFHVVIQPRAARDIEYAAHFLLDRSKSPAVARRWTRGIRAKIATLKTSPLRCPIDADSIAYGEEVRVLLYGKRHGKYRVLFSVRGEVVHVLTVRHSARQSLAEELGQQAQDEEDDA
jgi:plasmid stabilization system protein ParE